MISSSYLFLFYNLKVMKKRLIKSLKEALEHLNVSIDIELTPSKGHGDFSTNVAMKLSKKLKDSPQNIANKIIKNLKADFIKKAEVAGPGFINIFLNENATSEIVKNILEKKEHFGSGKQKKYINIEFVSANPTGYLHVAHARGAAVGETLANVLSFAGNKVDREYYINDAGNQMDTLAESAYIRYKQQLGYDVQLPDDSYQGEDIVEFAKFYIQKYKNKFKDTTFKDVKDKFKNDAKEYMMSKIKEHLKQLDVKFDIYYSEQSIYDKDLIKVSLDKLTKYGYTFEKDNALWLKTNELGDDKDRVLIKSDKKYTYLAPDIAYHDIKLSRGYDELINIWGADHIGYIKRMQIALKYLGLPSEKLDILIIQMVKLIKDGKELKMSKRAGTAFSIKDLIKLVGKDAVRFHMINRSNNSKFDFILDNVVKESNENPVFTIKYTHARANQLLNKSKEKIKIGIYAGKEILLINLLNKFPELVEKIANSHKVHLLTQYLIDLASEFNSFYSNYKIIGNKREAELLALVKASKIVIAKGLELVGVEAPERM